MSIEGQCHFLTLAQGLVHTKIQTGFLAHLSRRLIGELIVYPLSGVLHTSSVRRRRRPQCSNIFLSETACPIKAKFYVEPPWVGGTIFCSRHLGHMTKMAATPIYGKVKVKFGNLGFSIGKSDKSRFFRSYCSQ